VMKRFPEGSPRGASEHFFIHISAYLEGGYDAVIMPIPAYRGKNAYLEGIIPVQAYMSTCTRCTENTL